MLHYILQTIAFQVFFLIIYDVFLKNETFFNWNRVYLIATAFLSLILPFLKFDSIKAVVPEPMIIRLPEVIIGEIKNTEMDSSLLANSEQISEQAFTFSWTTVWIIGMVIAALILIYKIFKITKMLNENPKRWQGNALIVFLANSTSAFSFFHYIFLGTNIEPKKKAHILEHELIHVKDKHSVDLLIFEILRLLFWFNPLIYLYQKQIATLHEFIADAKAVKYKGKAEYYQNLLSQVFETQQISFTNPFFYQSLIKKRILMLSKSKSKQIHLLKYALLIPIVLVMLMYTSSYAGKLENSLIHNSLPVLNQELTMQELVDKYYNEMVSKNETLSESFENFNSHVGEEDKYIESKEVVARRQAFSRYWKTRIKAEKSNENFSEVEKLMDPIKGFKTYDEYLNYKKTDKAKRNWENKAKPGEVRLVVEDMKNLTEDEKKWRREKLASLKDKVMSLIMTDGKMSIALDNTATQFVVTNSNKKDNSENIEVPFAVIDEVPLFQGCEPSGSKEEDKLCVSNKVSEFVNKNFNVNIATENGLTGRQRISVIFKIGEDGKIKDVYARAPHSSLEAEAIRVIESLPDFTPGKQKGVAVTVPYSLPILFQVQPDAQKTDQNKTENTNEEEVLEQIQKKEQQKIDNQKISTVTETNKDYNHQNTLVPYAVVDEVPLFPSCENLDSKASKKDCTSEQIRLFFDKNFNPQLPKDSGLNGKQRIAIIFEIDEDGHLNNIKTRAPHPALEKEAVRVLKSMPKMIPGKQNGKPVTVPFSLPIIFEVP